MSNQEILNKVVQENQGKIGIICVNCLIVRLRFKELEGFILKKTINFPSDKELTKLDYLDYINIHYYRKMINSDSTCK